VLLPAGERLDILRGLELDVNDGESVAILGRSGSGKTTLLNIIGLLDRPDSGTYELDGLEVGTLSDTAQAKLRGARFGFVFQHFLLFPRRTAAANVAAPLYHASRSEYRARIATARHLLDTVGLGSRGRSLPSQLSGGEQQRVAIARSLCRNPKYLLADEPTGSLDVDTATEVLDVLFGVVREGRRALLCITHDAEVASRADRTLVLLGGRLTANGS
jgi:putative ABC transport system ATP-binding protein